MKQFLFVADAAPATPTTPAAPAAPAAPATPAAETQVTAAPETQATETQPADNGAPPPQQKGGLFGNLGPWFPMLLIFAIFYFLMIKPQQRKEKERQKMINELRAGAKVVFAGGLIGTIVEAKDVTFKIEIASGVAIEVARSAVQGLAAEGKPAEEPAKK